MTTHTYSITPNDLTVDYNVGDPSITFDGRADLIEDGTSCLAEYNNYEVDLQVSVVVDPI